MRKGLCLGFLYSQLKNRLSGKNLRYATANVEDEAHLDASARGFWGDQHQRRFFDVRVFNPTDRDTHIASLYRRFEREKQ